MHILNFKSDDKYPVGTMFCLGQNYAKHIKEMGSKVTKDPVIFMKPPASYVENGKSVLLPDFSDNVHHEVELVLVIKDDIYNITPEEALKHIGGVSVGVDMTLRDIQKQAKDNGKPWAVAKGFYTSAPIADFVPYEDINDLNDLDLMLEVNGETRQAANTSEMVMKCGELVSYISKVFSLRKGDIIFTGTPEGVSKVETGDEIYASLAQKGKILTDIKVSVE